MKMWFSLCTVKVKRHKLDGQRIKIESENYKYKDIILGKTINGLGFWEYPYWWYRWMDCRFN